MKKCKEEDCRIKGDDRCCRDCEELLSCADVCDDFEGVCITPLDAFMTLIERFLGIFK
jgi:hypothetical protein